jgi:hypothetical protein
MKTHAVKSFQELGRIVSKTRFKPSFQPKSPSVASYRLVDATEALVYAASDADDPILLSKMQNLRVKDKPHRVIILKH